MSDAFDRGRSFEVKVQKITRQKLHMDIRRDKQSGAGIHKQDVRDRYNELPIFIECKDHETIKPKAWWREADAKSNYGQAPVVVFPDNEEVLCVMRYTDLLQLVKEVADWKETAEDLQTPDLATIPPPSPKVDIPDIIPAVEKKIEHGAHTCRNGHIADEYGYCMQLDCKFSRGYKPKKVKNHA